ncbi:nuclear transport factor 2 family protein [Bowmanella dokdonensis]|uniref:Nuclear transport factor 2 family protein n=1 Tax=Bowmanella dokdonensis TaxID=751969 RepID=A0A939DMT4_9ALTE|nr:nuclear transport factor 2 family protein [Bowmanella dokdonensis]MBN7825485.1 nuclear transport factor 2 family protein [Bowmanella dokdonensis]
MFRLLFVLLALFCNISLAQEPVALHPDQISLLESDQVQLQENKRLVFEFWRQVFQTRDMRKAADYLAEDYIQHNPNLANGRKAFIEFFSRFEQQPVKAEIDNLVSIVAEGDKVILSFRRELPVPNQAGKSYTTTWFDMFRVKEGKIVEHWDNATVPKV